MVRSAFLALATDSTLPVCLVGKGPTFDRYTGRPQNSVLVGINQAAVACRAKFAFVTDVDVLTMDFLEALPPDSLLVMPYYPHVRFRPSGTFNLDLMASRMPQTMVMARNGRLVGYKSDRADRKWVAPGGKNWPWIRVRGFTAVGALNLFHLLGHRQVFTAGIDGGTQYHELFQNLIPLTNGQKSFSAQDKEFDRLRRQGMSITKL